MIHQYTKIEYEILDYYKFKDSQRFYQTDGLSAYIILCYNDNLTFDTDVYDLTLKSIIKFKDFISILNLLNLKRLNKII